MNKQPFIIVPKNKEFSLFAAAEKACDLAAREEEDIACYFGEIVLWVRPTSNPNDIADLIGVHMANRALIQDNEELKREIRGFIS